MKFRFDGSEEVFSVVIGGDVCPGGIGCGTASGDYAAVLDQVRDFISGADLRMVQWETPVAATPAPIVKSGPNLNSPEESIEVVASGGFDIALLANNHIGDHGPEAVMETIEKLHKRGLRTVGAGKDLAAARAPLVAEVKGKTVAVFDLAENEFGGAAADRPGCATQEPLQDAADVRAAARKYDHVIVVLHGGHERDPYPSPRLVRYCRALADAGAKLVFNCHTHCPEGCENWHGTPIVYSPGNLYFPRAGGANTLWRYGYLVRCSFGERAAAELELLPYYFSNSRVMPLDDADSASFESYMEKLCAPLSDPVRLQRLFEVWSTDNGKFYCEKLLRALPRGTGWLSRFLPPVMKRAMVMRNVFTCESHSDLVKCWLRLVEEKRVAEAAARYDADIREMQKGFAAPRGE